MKKNLYIKNIYILLTKILNIESFFDPINNQTTESTDIVTVIMTNAYLDFLFSLCSSNFTIIDSFAFITNLGL